MCIKFLARWTVALCRFLRMLCLPFWPIVPFHINKIGICFALINSWIYIFRIVLLSSRNNEVFLPCVSVRQPPVVCSQLRPPLACSVHLRPPRQSAVCYYFVEKNWLPSCSSVTKLYATGTKVWKNARLWSRFVMAFLVLGLGPRSLNLPGWTR